MSGDTVREVLGRLAGSTYALSALAMALRARAGERQPAPELRAHLDEVLGQLGVREAIADVGPIPARAMLGEIRMALFHGAHRLGAGGQGWTHVDPAVLQAAGEVSAGFAGLLQRFAPALDGLAARLASEGARFLDVGVGVAALSIEMVRAWPGLRVLGIDVWAPALALARDNVRRAELDARIELREQGVQDLAEAEAFDLAWLPSAFIPGGLLPEAVRRVHRALRPGGWVIVAAVNTTADPLALALARLRTAEWGAHAWSPAEAHALLEGAGFDRITALPSPPGAVVAFFAGRRGP